MDASDLIALGIFLYAIVSIALHRVRLRRLHRDGLELSLLRRVDASCVPPEAQPVLDAIARADAARALGDLAAREREAHVALSAIRKAGGTSAHPGLAYLDAQVRLAYLTSAVNLELVGVSALIGLKRALKRFGPHAELHLGLAHARAILGQTQAALDELGRAVYYANGAPFYTELVLDSEFVEKHRPRLRQECLEREARQLT